ncbi:phosphoenolpyruvate--protein phosphotransferase [Salinicola sp. JS01]|uniref:phosphoenolpyruvate--protein phosphotransferase n=1 Tax=Salinicola sp. JS01 TaxID=3050071 RepID=UPI00255C211B|nr:phosphoenolpyruvate--protein phosphotransferase [Salinicola sp. JS01]WIX31455.1 phosphoenolpyruvate--protein phosphotransferase [Salinicola sp. JS01]
MAASPHMLSAPLRGLVVALGELPDPVFAAEALGPGIALDPLDDALHAPCDGEVIQCARTRHALTLRDAAGGEWLLHLGLDTVDLAGDGFSLLVAEGERVSAGTPLLRFDADRVARQARALLTPIVLTNAVDQRLELLVTPGQVVERGEPLLLCHGEAVAGTDSASATQAVSDAGRDAASSVDECTDECTGEGTGEGTGECTDEGAEARGGATVAAASGIHARPAARLRAIARAHDVALRLVTADGREADAASVSALLNLGLVQGSRVTLVARGAQRQAALAAASALLGAEEASDVSMAPEAVSTAPDAAPTGNVSTAPETAPPVSGVRQLEEGLLRGISASAGIAIGPLRRYDPPLPRVAETAADPAAERQALAVALETVAATLEAARRSAETQGQQEEAEIFDAHLAWLEDPALRAAAERHINAGQSAGQGWYAALQAEVERLRQSDSALLAARVDDLRDLQRRVMVVLAADNGAAEAADDDLDGAILIAREMTPSQFVAVAGRIQGLCLAAGGATSHLAILARARGIPCVMGLGEALLQLDAEQAVLDATRGVLERAPDAERLAAFVAERERRQAQARSAAEQAGAAVITRDGRQVQVAANVGSAAEAQAAARAGADGVGLLRSEFLFLGRSAAPTREAQRQEYAAALAALGGKPVIVRLLDIGADKQLDYLSLPAAPNPALGERGIRLWQTFPELFETQLDALLLAGNEAPAADAATPLQLMLPMVSDVGELRWVRQRLAARAAALGVDRLPALGVMIEVPSAALCAASLAREADFFSVGTNDLTQYALAMDREVAALAAHCDVLHPGVLRLIQATLEGARGRCPVGVCGAAAGDPLAAALLVAMGVDELSLEAAGIAAIKAWLRELDAAALAARVPELLALDDGAAVRAALAAWLDASATDAPA